MTRLYHNNAGAAIESFYFRVEKSGRREIVTGVALSREEFGRVGEDVECVVFDAGEVCTRS